MAERFQFAHRLPFEPADAEAILRTVPARAGVFALRGERTTDQPYLTRAADLRRRLRRLLAPPEVLDAEGRPVLTKRLNLRDRVRWIEWTETGSEFEAVLTLYRASLGAFGEEDTRKRMRLYPPNFLRVTMTHEHPRVYVTNRMSRRGLAESFGPFASRAAADRMAEAVGDLFKLRRCHEDLVVHPEHPGCAYGEMKRCLAPCKAACSAEDYAAETQGVFGYLRSRGESLMAEIAAKREAASEAMDFEGAAALHRQWEKAKAVAGSADPLVRSAAEVRALVVQEAVREQGAHGSDEAAVFLLENGRLLGPEPLSTLGVRAVREQTAVGSSLFAQPLMLTAIPEPGPGPVAGVAAGSEPIPEPAAAGVAAPAEDFAGEIRNSPLVEARATALSPEDRAREVVLRLEAQARALGEPEPAERGDALALFKRWYYRPEKSRAGEVLLPNPDGSWPVRRLLNAAARVTLGPPAELPAVDRDAAKSEAVQSEAKTRVLHPGRDGVERVVPVLPKRSKGPRRGKAVLPSEAVL